MAHRSLSDVEAPRPRRGPPPRLYVIARRSPVPWLRVRRLGEADRAVLAAHLQRLAAERPSRARAGLDEAIIAARCASLDFARMVAFGAVAGNAVIAAACGVPGREGLAIGVTEDQAYREHGLGTMLVSQVRGAGPGAVAAASSPVDAEHALLRLVQGLGGRIER